MWPSILSNGGLLSDWNNQNIIFLVTAAILFFIASLSEIFGISPAEHILPSTLKVAGLAIGERIGGDGNYRPSFYDVAKKTGTDKVTIHEYHWMYEKYLPAFRDKKFRMLEIGLGCDMQHGPGASYYTWLQYFPNVELFFIENDESCVSTWQHAIEGATVFTGNQADPEFLENVIASTGGSFDIIIDDGGHAMEQQQTSLEHLWKVVRPGGIYFLEDLQTSFMDYYGGDEQYGDDREKKTTLKYIFELMNDKMLPPDQVQAGIKHKGITSSMRGMECQREICAFFKKDETKISKMPKRLGA